MRIAALLLALIVVPGHELEEPHVVFIVGESEYDTVETLPAFAASELQTRGVRVTFVVAEENRFPGIEAVAEADLLVLSIRRRTPPTEQLELIRTHLRQGKPLVALRTSSHAFALRSGTPPDGHAGWPAFDVDVLGGRYEGHYDNRDGTDVFVRPEQGRHPILADVKHPSFRSGGTLYRSRDLKAGADVLMDGRAVVDGRAVEEPVAWTHRFGRSRIFYTSLGHPADFEEPAFRRMVLNAVFWAMDRTPPLPENVDERVAEFLQSYEGRGDLGGRSEYRRPEETLRALHPADDVTVDLIAAEPTIYQPIDVNFDHRGRLWVVQYNQYPDPEGLTVTGADEHLRARYDAVPEPPPGHRRGADRVTVLSDRDGDGYFEEARDVITGLNIATSVLIGRGGIWVMSPPYLLFYPDADDDGVPDGPPEVHLRGFGLEDTHAVANSLTWGPDGWIYGAQGSTTTANVSSEQSKNVRFDGQAIWRYHPEHRVFEVFAEGGGNTFHVTFDSAGRLYSGHNGGRARAFHYRQGGYYLKNWGKHGALTNPYAFGYFPPMAHEGDGSRFTHAETVYEGAALPPRYDGTMISLNPLHRFIVVSRLEQEGSTFRTVDTHRLVDSEDPWFRPVDIRVGPDGAVYVADWYDDRLSHADPRDTWHRASGRVYRVRGDDFAPAPSFDLSLLSTNELIDRLDHPNRWHRFEAMRLLGDRNDAAAAPRLRRMLHDESGPLALHALWSLNLSGGFTETVGRSALAHENPHVRRWAVRLLGDGRTVSPRTAAQLVETAGREPHPEVRSQLAATAGRLGADAALSIVGALLHRSEDAADPHIPLQLWWAVEAHAVDALALFEEPSTWTSPVAEDLIAPNLMRRYVLAGDLMRAARLMELSPDPGLLADPFLEALRLSDVDSAALPPALSEAVEDYESQLGRSALALGIQRGDAARIREALDVVADRDAETRQRAALIDLFGEIERPEAAPVLLDLLREGPAVQRAALRALARYEQPEIGRRIVSLYPNVLRADSLIRLTALETLAVRPSWTRHLIEAVETGRVRREDIPPHTIDRMELHTDVSSLRPDASDEAWTTRQIVALVETGEGRPAAGRAIFGARCGTCHKLFDDGGSAGPDLTGYDRSNTADMAFNTVHPHVEIREGYAQYLVRTTDGRSLTGVLAERTSESVTVRSPSGSTTRVAARSIEEMRALRRSLMPSGLLDSLTEQEVRDLFAYLQSSER